MNFQGKRTAELALALGVQEVRPVDLVTAYGTLANGGKEIGHTTILTVKDTQRQGRRRRRTCRPPASRSVSPQAAYIVTDILAGNTNPNVNPFWGKFAIDGPDGRRPATLKTGTNNDAKDLNAYGYIAPPTAGRTRRRRLRPRGRGLERQLRQQPRLDRPRAALLDRRLDLRLAGLPQRGQRQVAGHQLREAGRRPGPGQDRPVHRAQGRRPARSVDEWFIVGTEPQGHARRPIPAASTSCSRSTSRASFGSWMTADRDWLRRARTWAGRRRRPGPDPDGLLLQRRLPPVRRVVGRAGRGAAAASPARRRRASSCPTPDPRGVIPSFAIPIADRVRPGRGPLPAREPVRVAVGRAVARTVRCHRASRHRPSRHRRRPTPEPTPTPKPTPTPTPTHADVTPPPPPVASAATGPDVR